MQIKNVVKKLVVCGLSLAMIGGSAINTTQVSAHSNHIKTVRIKFSNSKYKPLKYHQLLKVMTKDYKLYIHTNYYNDTYHKEVLAQKYRYWIMNTLWHNLKHYNKSQLNQICKNPDANNESYLPKSKINYTGFTPTPYPTIENYIKDKNFIKTDEVPKLSKQDTSTDTEIRRDLVNDINQTRIKYGRKPLIVDNIMQKVANYRAKKVLYGYEHQDECLKYEHISRAKLDSLGGSTDNWIHGEDTHTSGGEYLDRHGYDSSNWSANAGATYYDQLYSSDYLNVPYKYPSDTPAHIAHNINDDYINYDNFYPEYNGHRDTELDPHSKYLGVGVAYSPQDKLYADNEQYYE